MTATLQLALPLDPLADDLTEAERAAHEAAAAHQAEHRAALALPAPRCNCGPRAWGEPGHCQRCGRDRA